MHKTREVPNPSSRARATAKLRQEKGQGKETSATLLVRFLKVIAFVVQVSVFRASETRHKFPPG